jgi:hypothetical protein
MAWLQNRNESWRVLFRYDGRQHTLWLGDVGEGEAQSVAAKVDYWVMRLKQQLVTLPPGCDVVTFIQHEGKPPSYSVSKAKELTLSGLRKAYFESQKKRLEQTTLSAISLHFDHLVRILGGERLIPTMSRGDLQAYADKRSSEWIDPNVYRIKRREKDAAKKPRKNRKPPPPRAEDKPRRHPSSATIKKEIVSFRTAWNWARRHLGLTEEFRVAASITSNPKKAFHS